MSGSAQFFALHEVEAVSLADVLDGRLKPNMVKRLREQAVDA